MSRSAYLILANPAPTGSPSQTVITASSTYKTLLQVEPATGVPATVIAWGISFATVAADLTRPVFVDLCETTVAATTGTAVAAAEVYPYSNANAPANSAGGSGIPFNLGVSQTAYAAFAGEGSVTAFRLADMQSVSPIGSYNVQFPLGREFTVLPGRFLRIRVSSPAQAVTVGSAYVVLEV